MSILITVCKKKNAVLMASNKLTVTPLGHWNCHIPGIEHIIFIGVHFEFWYEFMNNDSQVWLDYSALSLVSGGVKLILLTCSAGFLQWYSSLICWPVQLVFFNLQSDNVWLLSCLHVLSLGCCLVPVLASSHVWFLC